MASVPKRAAERFIHSVSKFQRILQAAKDRDINESDTVAILNDVFSEVFGYDKYAELTSEFAIRGTFCDIAIKIEDKVQFLIEAKAIGIELKDAHMRQALDYGANHGVQWIILTNGIEWKIYRIRFEQPINYDLVCSFNFLALNARDENDQERLYVIAREGLSHNSREDYFEKIQSVNRYVIGNLILAEPVLSTIRRELKKLSGGMKIEHEEVCLIVKNDVLKREIVDGDMAVAAQARIKKYYRKAMACAAPAEKPAKAIDNPSNHAVIEPSIAPLEQSQ